MKLTGIRHREAIEDAEAFLRYQHLYSAARIRYENGDWGVCVKAIRDPNRRILLTFRHCCSTTELLKSGNVFLGFEHIGNTYINCEICRGDLLTVTIPFS